MKYLLFFIIFVLVLLLFAAYVVVAERRLIAFVQRRLGPNKVGILGILQPIADALKLIKKEPVQPEQADFLLFLIAPVFAFTVSVVCWAVIPVSFSSFISDISLGVMYLLSLGSIGVYGVLYAGWSSNSKYAFLGSLRSAAQMVSYEIVMGINILSVVVVTGSMNLTAIVEAQMSGVWNIFPLTASCVIYFISSLAEHNRPPFDLPEAEAELVAGYNVEYSSMAFALFYLAEYINVLLASSILVLLFLGGWAPILDILSLPSEVWFSLKASSVVLLHILVRSIVPRLRFDQLMYFGWKVAFPISALVLVIVVCLLYLFV